MMNLTSWVREASLKVDLLRVLADEITLDGEVQRGVQEIGQGWLVRAVRGPDGNPRHKPVGPNGYLFDQDAEEFILERVTGKIEVSWKNVGRAREFLEAAGLDPARFGA